MTTKIHCPHGTRFSGQCQFCLNEHSQQSGDHGRLTRLEKRVKDLEDQLRVLTQGPVPDV